MRSALALLAFSVVSPVAAQTGVYKAIRPGEVRGAAFLTEMRAMPFGEVLGPVTPPAVASGMAADLAAFGSTIAVRPPSGATYRRGDTVTLASVVPGPRGWGNIVIPTGLARIGASDPRQTLATVIAVWGPIRDGQVTLPLEPLAASGTSAPNKVEGPAGSVVFSRELRELQQIGSELFVDIGRAAGVRLGDFVEVRRRPGPRLNAADRIDESMAVGQVVHVGDKVSTIKLFRLTGPDITPGTPVVRIATLPN